MGWKTTFGGVCVGGPYTGRLITYHKEVWTIFVGHADGSPPRLKGTYRYDNGEWIWESAE